jgi:CRISPR-associated endonuclease Cas1
VKPSESNKSEPSIANGVLALSGYGLRVTVERGHLVTEDGVGTSRRVGRFARVGSGIRRLIVVGHSGSVSLDALQWMRGINAAFVHIDNDGELVSVGRTTQPNDVRLRRCQALATFFSQGVDVARYLLTTKVEGQLKVLGKVPRAAEAREVITTILREMRDADSLGDLRHMESRAAASYWDALRDLPVRFVGRDAAKVPTHWNTVGSRGSVLTESPRKAVTPAHALLNYLYAIVEAEARIASLAMGCDPGLGVIHTDSGQRDSFACDLMEAVRPIVDEYVLHLLATRTFLKSDFFETLEGVCRIMPPFTSALAQTAPAWAKRLAPVAEHAASLLMSVTDELASGGLALKGHRKTASSKIRPAFRTPLTGRNRSRQRGRKADADRNLSSELALPLPRRCKECGVAITHKRRTLCDSCLSLAPARASAKGAIVLRQLRATGQDARSTPSNRRKRSKQTRRQAVEIAAWKRINPVRPSDEIFTIEILPTLRALPTASIASATGLSKIMCAKVRRGEIVPHPRHWPALRELAKGSTL